MLNFMATRTSAEIVNGSFESGLSGWGIGFTFPSSEVGIVAQGAFYNAFDGVLPTDGSSMARLLDDGGGGTEAGLGQAFFAGVGDTLSFDYAVSNDFGGPFEFGYNSHAGITLHSLPFGSFYQTLAYTQSTESTPGWWNHVEVPIEAAGNYYLSFSVNAPNDHLQMIGMLVDRVVLNSQTTMLQPSLPTTVLPGSSSPPVFVFESAPSGQWFDPPMAAGFAYEMTGDSLFTGILDFPTGFNQPFTVAVGDTVLGQYGPGQSVDFTSFPGGGVTSFQVTGLDPGADPESPTAFPLKLLFDTGIADFTMQAILEVPEPSSFALCALGLVGLAWQFRRARRRVA
ncbi:MAG: PEP-CTERM sorting domain-containing protein [Pirellulales bacterium]